MGFLSSLFGGSLKDLEEAILEGDMGKLEKIVNKNPSLLEKRNKDGMTALALAARKGDSGMIKLFLEKGADIDAVDAEGKTALIIAAEGTPVPFRTIN